MSNDKNHLGYFKQFGKELFTYGVMGGIAKVIQFILFPIFTRVFSTSEYGILDSISVFTSLIGMGIALSLPSALNRYFYDNRVKNNPSLYSTLLLFTIIFAIVVLSIVTLFSDQIGSILTGRSNVGYYIILSALSAVFTAISNLPNVLLRLRKKIVAYNLLNIAKTISFVVLSLGSVFILEMGLVGIFLSMAISSAIPFIMGLFLNKSFLTLSIDFKVLKRSLKFSLPMFPAVFVTWANKQADRIIILTYVGLSGVGVFGAGFRISNIMQLFTSIFQKAWGPFAMEILEKEGRNEFYQKALTMYSTFVTIASVIIIGFSWEILWIIAPTEYHDSFFVIPWLLGATICHGSLGVINIGTVVSEKTFANTLASWSGFIVNVSLTILLVKLYGIQGAAIGTFIAELITAVILWNRSIKLTDIKFKTVAISSIVVTYIITSVLIIILHKNNLFDIPNIIWRLTISLVSVGVIASIGLSKNDFRVIKKLITKKVSKE